MVALATEEVENGPDIIDESPDDWFDLEPAFDLDAEGVYDNDDEPDDAVVCMTYTGDWSEPFVADVPSSEDTADRISTTHILHHAFLTSSMRYKEGNVNHAIDFYDALRCKFRQIGIYNSTDFLDAGSRTVSNSRAINMLLSDYNLPTLRPTMIEAITADIHVAKLVKRSEFSGNIIQDICGINTNLFEEELNGDGAVCLEKLCHQVACLQQKSFPNKWTNDVMRKLIRASVDSPSELKSYIVHETLNARLRNAGGTGLHPTTQKGFLALIDGNQDFR